MSAGEQSPQSSAESIARLTAERHGLGGLGEVSRERLNLSELVRLLVVAGSRNVADRSSVRLTRNAKGDTQIEVVVGAGEPGVESVSEVAEKACELYDHLRELYPLGEPPAGEEVS